MENGASFLHEIVVAPLTNTFTVFWSFMPSIVSAILIIIIGAAISKFIEKIIIKLLKMITLDKLADQVQLSTILAKGGIRLKLSELVGAIIYWLLILAFAMMALDALQLSVGADLLLSLVSFLPRVVLAVFMLIIGIFAAAFLAATVRTAASNAGILQAHLLGQLVQGIVIIFSCVAALQQLEIQFIGEVFLILLAGVSLGVSLAFGLGCKDLAGRWVEDIIQQVKTRKR